MIDLLIVGAGPAGLTAALYASRAGCDVTILDGGAPGGKLNVSAEIENWPGIKATSGPSLAYEMYEHALSFGAKHEYGQVLNLEKNENGFKIITEDNVFEAKSVIIASGTVERKLGLESEDDLTGRGISYCAVCDGPFFKDDEVAVVGGGNAALEESLYLTKFASKVHIIVRRDEFRADKIAQDRVFNNEKIQVHFLRKPKSIVQENNKVSGLVLENSEDGTTEELEVKAIFPYVGMDPVTNFVKELNITDLNGYIVTNEKMETSIKGLYAAGDVRVKALRQVVTATGDGATAGQEANHYIELTK